MSLPEQPSDGLVTRPYSERTDPNLAPEHPDHAGREILILLFMILLTVLLYGRSLNAPLVMDDKQNISENPHVRLTYLSPHSLIKAGFESPARNRPAANISFALNYYFHQYDFKPYHAVNVVIHLLAGIFLYFFIKTTLSLPALRSGFGPGSLIPFFAAVIWLVHPLQIQSVTYLVQRMTGLAAMFYILALLLYVRGRLSPDRVKSWAWFAGAVLAGVLALGSKEIAVTLPLFIFLYEWYFFQNLSWSWLKRCAPYFGAAVFILVFVSLLYLGAEPLNRILSGYGRRDFTLLERTLTQFRVVVFYLGLLILPLPSRLNLDHDFALSHSLLSPPSTLPALGFILALIGLAVFLAKKDRLISFCLLWFFGNLVLESSIIPLEIIFEHRTYLPSMMTALLAVIMVYRLVKPEPVRAAILTAAVVILSMWTYERNIVWADEVALWRDCVQKSPNKYRPHNNLGNALVGRGGLDEALDHYQQALSIDPGRTEAHVGLGIVLGRQGRLDEAIYHFSEALRIGPESIEAHNGLGFALNRQGKFKEAAGHYLRAIELKPWDVQAYNNLGVALAGQDRFEEALAYFAQALRLNPAFDEAHNNLGITLARQGRGEQAIAHFYEALRINPGYAEAHASLGIALKDQGLPDEAEVHFQEALWLKPGFALARKELGETLALKRKRDAEFSRLQKDLEADPQNPDLHYRLGNACLSKGDLDKAIIQYQRALGIQPGYVPALNDLAIVYVMQGKDEQALVLFRYIAEHQPDNAAACYNLASIYARQNKVEEAIFWLKEAVGRGFDNWAQLQANPGLENIRQTAYYRELMKDR